MGEVTDYIAGLEEPARSVLERYRARAVAVVPQALDALAARRRDEIDAAFSDPTG